MRRDDSTSGEGAGMVFSAIVGRAARLVATGLAGAATYDGLKKVLHSRVVHDAAVTATAVGLRGVRALEVGAEKARLSAADIVSEAREKLGEQTPPPTSASRAHEHDR
jgi:Protein of unknown function (DUF1490)